MPRVTEEYYEKKRREIIDAAYRVCVRKPITSVEMKDIIAETGFSHGVVYRYYRDLDEVLSDLVISINKEHRIDGEVDRILDESGTERWKESVRSLCTLLADYMCALGGDLMKVSVYCDVLAISEPDRVLKVADRITEGAQSPLVYLTAKFKKYLKRVVKENGLKPVHKVDTILQYFVVSFQGIQMGYVLSESLSSEQTKGK